MYSDAPESVLYHFFFQAYKLQKGSAVIRNMPVHHTIFVVGLGEATRDDSEVALNFNLNRFVIDLLSCTTPL